ncbi:MAG TPA: outer membrane protein assembly factor BamE, partial [Methylocella sp.]
MTARGRGGKRRAPRSTKLALATALALGLGGCLGYDGQVVHGYQLDPKSAEQVKAGASAEQILVLLGTPTTTSTVGGDAWYYI